MDFAWTANQEELRRAALQFAGRSLNNDLVRRDAASEFSRESWNACARFGIQGLLVPARYGGAGLSPLDALAALEGLGCGCRDGGLLVSLHAHTWGCQNAVLRFGTDEQKSRFLPPLVSGETIGAHAMTETESGSQVFSLRARAAKDGNDYVLNGVKVFITNAGVADLFTVYARTGGPGFPGISCFLVERGTPGLGIGRNYEKMGLRTSPMAEVVLDDCRVPAGNLLGAEGSGGVVFTDGMEWERTFTMATLIGALEHQLCQCTDYAARRRTGGTPLGDNPVLRGKISDMYRRLESSRLLVYKAAWLKERGEPAFVASALAKVAASEAAANNGRDAVQIHGAYGYMSEAGLERELRDALGGTIYSGTTEVLNDAIARLLQQLHGREE